MVKSTGVAIGQLTPHFMSLVAPLSADICRHFHLLESGLLSTGCLGWLTSVRCSTPRTEFLQQCRMGRDGALLIRGNVGLLRHLQRLMAEQIGSVANVLWASFAIVLATQSRNRCALMT